MARSTVPEYASRDALFAACRVGDSHRLGGWQWVESTPRKLTLLVERGARHHIFSAIALDDMELVRVLVAASPDALSRRRSRFEQGQTALHFALAAPDGLMRKAPQYEMADLLITLGADVEAVDDKGCTPLELAMLHGDLEAMRRLKAAGAKEPKAVDPSAFDGGIAALSDSIQRIEPMFSVPDMAATVAWYTSMGFTLEGRHPEVAGWTGPGWNSARAQSCWCQDM